MNKEEDIFEQLTLSEFTMWSLSALKIFNNCNKIMANNSDNIRIS